MVRIIIFIISYLLFRFANAQEVNIQALSLDDCIDIALQNNLDVKGSALRAGASEVNLKQAKSELLPSLNGNYSLGITNGRSIDPFTNDYINQQLTYSNAGLNLNMVVFNGFRILNTIKQSRLNMQAADMELLETRQTLVLDVTLAYIQVLNNRDRVLLSQSQMETTRKQLNRLQVLYREETGNPADYNDMQGQLASDKMNLISAQNALQESVLNLLQLMNNNTDPKNTLTFKNLEGLTDTQKYTPSSDDVFNEALKNLATFKSKELRVEAANSGIKAARSGYFPEIAVFGQLNTNYSSAAETFTQTGTLVEETGDFININDDIFPVLRNNALFEADKISYNDQFENNLNSTVGISVSIPLFNGFRTKNAVALKKIETEEAKVTLQNTRLQLKQAVETAYMNMEAAYNRYYILKDQAKAFEESFRINEIRYNNGVSNVVEYITSKNNLDTARLNLSNARYEYLLRVKILDYYRGV
ncbi:TolC family protein [Abyssalbus ytuae]|uniref:TolC family protein n=1 Tax=Abyssalbus ytuae TaxID=2926907 RepID=A0A9E6ZSV3_9FLAO|nr:TolC family protein [Abyssalbus ytuae]UOB16066.1 TolC family protein [Abyssalbus ytuae]